MEKVTPPLLSVIVPIYNVEVYLPRCIDSILNQIFTDFELILVDDGSPDKCGDICDKYAQEDSRIVVIHKKNGGLGSARNAGLDIARGTYIAFVDSDDYISEDCYEANMKILLRDKTIDILEFPIYIEEGQSIKLFPIPGYRSDKHLYEKKDIFLFWSNDGVGVRGFVWQNIYKRGIWDSVRFIENIAFEDCLAQSEILDKVSHVFLSDFGKYFYVQRSGSILHSNFDKQKWIDDFNATIPFLHKMVYYGVDRKYVIKFYCVTLNRIIDKSYSYGIDSFREQIKEINRAHISISEMIFADIRLKQKIKLIMAKAFGINRYLKVSQILLHRRIYIFL